MRAYVEYALSPSTDWPVSIYVRAHGQHQDAVLPSRDSFLVSLQRAAFCIYACYCALDQDSANATDELLRVFDRDGIQHIDDLFRDTRRDVVAGILLYSRALCPGSAIATLS